MVSTVYQGEPIDGAGQLCVLLIGRKSPSKSSTRAYREARGSRALPTGDSRLAEDERHYFRGGAKIYLHNDNLPLLMRVTDSIATVGIADASG